jgi:hypothetical protein
LIPVAQLVAQFVAVRYRHIPAASRDTRQATILVAWTDSTNELLTLTKNIPTFSFLFPNHTTLTTMMSSSSAGNATSASFEATQALELESSRPDNIHWERECAYRNQAYRYLHHQHGGMGTIQIRLVEAANLRRSYWSPLALGPVKLLGLSKAHGPVSSLCRFSLSFRDEVEASTTTLPNQNQNQNQRQTTKEVLSPMIPQDDNPVWNNCQLELPLAKASMRDGQQIFIQVRVHEDATPWEYMVPGIPSGGDERLLGMGLANITPLCLGQTLNGHQAQSGVLDTWISIRMPQPQLSANTNLKEDNNNNNNNDDKDKKQKPAADAGASSTGRVRILISYQPHGMEPQPHDIVALEAFARRDKDRVSCRPILPPLSPLFVLQVAGPWLLVEYRLDARSNTKACLRLHRNAVFVIERKTYIDETIHLALLPADIFRMTPFGRSTADFIQPFVVASRQLLMPALLSYKLVWMAVRTTTLASITGVHAASSALWTEGSNSLTQDGEDANQHRRRIQQRSDSSSYKFVTL